MPPDILEQESFMEKVYDFQAKQQIEDGGKVWVGNRYKILYVFKRAKKYLKPGMHVCDIFFCDGYFLFFFMYSGLLL
jgi:organic radical activating enzyme